MRLNIRSKDGKLRRVELPANGVLVIGRAETSDIVLSDMTVSRRHAEISESGGECFINDAGSTAGTWVNGEKINIRRRLLPSDIVNIGSFEISLSVSEPNLEGEKPAPAKSVSVNTEGKMPMYDVQTSTEMYSDNVYSSARPETYSSRAARLPTIIQPSRKMKLRSSRREKSSPKRTEVKPPNG